MGCLNELKFCDVWQNSKSNNQQMAPWWSHFGVSILNLTIKFTSQIYLVKKFLLPPNYLKKHNQPQLLIFDFLLPLLALHLSNILFFANKKYYSKPDWKILQLELFGKDMDASKRCWQILGSNHQRNNRRSWQVQKTCNCQEIGKTLRGIWSWGWLMDQIHSPMFCRHIHDVSCIRLKICSD